MAFIGDTFFSHQVPSTTYKQVKAGYDYTSVQSNDPSTGNRESPVDFSGKSQGDIASLLNVPRGMINQIRQKRGVLTGHVGKHIYITQSISGFGKLIQGGQKQ